MNLWILQVNVSKRSACARIYDYENLVCGLMEVVYD
jgi:hypothetical protein